MALHARKRQQQNPPDRAVLARLIAAALLVVALLVTALLGLSIGLDLARPAHAAQGGDCTVTASQTGAAGETITIEFRSDPSINFFQPPGWRYQAFEAGGSLIATGQRQTGSVGPLGFPTPPQPGKYRIEVRSDGEQACSTSVSVADLHPSPDTTPPVVQLSCPGRAIQGSVITLIATIVSPGGQQGLTPVWIGPGGAEESGLEVELQLPFFDLGIKKVSFDLRDQSGNAVVSDGCLVMVDPIVISADNPNVPSSLPPTSVPPTAVPPTSVPATSVPPTSVPATSVPAAPTATPVPPTPVPPTPVPPTPVPATSVPATLVPATATPVPAQPTATPAPTPTIGLEPDLPPLPSPTAAGTDDAPPDDAPADTEGTDDAPSDDGMPREVIGADFPPNPIVMPGKLRATWPRELRVLDEGTVEVELIAADWTDDADLAKYDAGFIVIMSSATETREYPIYGVSGTIELDLRVSRQLSILNTFGDAEPSALRTVDFTLGGRDSATWTIQAIEPGQATIEIRSSYVKQASTEDPLSGEELAALTNLGSFNLDLVLDIAATDRTEWLDINPLMFGPLLALPFLAVASLFIGRWRGSAGGSTALLTPALRPAQAPVATARIGAVVGRDLGIVLSGGGTRASAFSLGVVMSLLDQRRYNRVGQIASVSGGSLTNGYLAGLRHGLGRYPQRAEDVRLFATRIASRGLPLERSAMVFGATAVAAIGWVAWIMFRAAPSFVQGLSGTVAGSFLFLFGAWLIYSWAGIRPAVGNWVHRFLDISDDLTLGQLGSSADVAGTDINHVFTSTAPGASHVHLSNRRSVIDPLPPAKAAFPPAVIETGSAAAVPVAKAAQASAAFPGLPHVRLRAEDMGFASVSGSLSLRDGGTVDNLGHIGATLDDTSADGSDYRRALTEWDTIERWIVVDSSAEVRSAVRRTRWHTRLLEVLHIGFAADLAEIATTGAANTTHARARQLTERFAADKSGLYLHLRQSPVDACFVAIGWYDGAPDDTFAMAEAVVGSVLSGRGVPPAFATADPRARRGAELLQVLHAAEGGDIAATWAARTRRNGSVPTTLSSLGAARTASLLHHGYVLASVNAVLDFGWPVPSPQSVSLGRFTELVG